MTEDELVEEIALALLAHASCGVTPRKHGAHHVTFSCGTTVPDDAYAGAAWSGHYAQMVLRVLKDVQERTRSKPPEPRTTTATATSAATSTAKAAVLAKGKTELEELHELLRQQRERERELKRERKRRWFRS